MYIATFYKNNGDKISYDVDDKKISEMNKTETLEDIRIRLFNIIRQTKKGQGYWKAEDGR